MENNFDEISMPDLSRPIEDNSLKQFPNEHHENKRTEPPFFLMRPAPSIQIISFSPKVPRKLWFENLIFNNNSSIKTNFVIEIGL